MTGSDARPTWVPLELLGELGMPPSALPMVVPYGFRGGAPFAVERAVALGLRHTPLESTVRDTLTWDDAAGTPSQGLSPADERRLLEAWGSRHGKDR